MPPVRSLFRRSCVAGLATVCTVAAAPIATPDNYTTPEDTPLSIAAPGVLVNDNPNGITGPMNAAKVADPVHGTLALQPDGSLTYTPAANYFGPDSFQYKVVQSQGPITFTVDQPNSILTVNVKSNILATGVQDDETTTARAKGTMTAQITPSQAPFSTAQIRTLDIAMAQQASLTLCVVEFLGGCVGTLTARIEPDGLAITMREEQAGPAGNVAAGIFDQPGNHIDTTGTIFLSTGGLASGIEVPPSAALNSTDMAYDFNDASIAQNGGILTLTAPIDVTQVVTDPQYTATVRVTGTVRATAPVPAAGAESAPVTVALNVTSVDDPPIAVVDRYFTRQNHAITIPAAASQPFPETLIAGNSAWKYATGTDLGTGWRAVDFVDTGWSSGAGVLGYDTDNPIATTIPARANMAAAASTTNPNYPTAYFRKEIQLTAASSTIDARMEFQRDDACIIYLNGTEVYRDSTPYAAGSAAPFAAAGEIAYATYCAASITPDSDGAAYKSIAIDPALLREGKNVIAAQVHQASNTSSDLRFDLKLSRTAQPTEALVGGGSIWKYATGASLGTAWRSAEYNDGGWQGAAGPLGYDSDIPVASTIPARANMAAAASVTNPNYPTAYFRREFVLTNPYDTLQPRVEFQRDDACVVYVNGVEIFRDSIAYPGDTDPDVPLPASGEVAYATYAADTIPEPDSLAYKSVAFSRGLLREGKNVIAAEVHQAGATSSDLRFDLKCYRSTGVGGLGSNDSDIDGPAMHMVVHSPPANGSVALNPDGSFTYLPNPGFPDTGNSATDTFAYRHTVNGASLPSSTVLVPMSSSWKYLDTGVAAPTDAGITPADWRNAAFPDSAWKTGIGDFGYGDGGEGTVVEDNGTAGYIATDTDRYITTYFRRKFEFPGATELVTRLKVRVIRDDGVVIFLNGRRIVKDNLPDIWTHTTVADTSIGGADESTAIEWLDIPVSSLRAGENILAAEIHQATSDSSDISFDMEFSAEVLAGARVEVIVLNDDLDGDNVSDTWERSFGLDASVTDGDADNDGDGQSNRAEFLAGTNPVNASSRFHTGFLTQSTAGQWQLAIDSVTGRTYQLQRSDALGAWLDTGPEVAAHANNPETIIQFNKPAAARQFYRVRVVNDWR